MLSQQRRDRLVDAFKQALADRAPDQGGDDRLGGGLYVDRLIEGRAAQALFDQCPAVLCDDQGMQALKPLCLGDNFRDLPGTRPW